MVSVTDRQRKLLQQSSPTALAISQVLQTMHTPYTYFLIFDLCDQLKLTFETTAEIARTVRPGDWVWVRPNRLCLNQVLTLHDLCLISD